MSLRERHEQVRRFTHGDATLLLATDAASEGLNLQRRCRLVIHLEMPWTPLRLEQRIGRVDRLGQERTVHAIHLLAHGTQEELLAVRLSNRSRTAEHAIRAAARQASVAAGSPLVGAEPSVPQDNDVAEETSCIDRVVVERECRQFVTIRALEARAAASAAEFPFETVVRPSDRLLSLVALRLSLVDAAGMSAWESLVGVRMATHLNEPQALSPADIQVWLLKTDGTAVARIPGVVTGAGRSSDNRGNLSVGYRFARIPAGELAGVVVSYKGKLLVREIKSN